MVRRWLLDFKWSKTPTASRGFAGIPFGEMGGKNLNWKCKRGFVQKVVPEQHFCKELKKFFKLVMSLLEIKSMVRKRGTKREMIKNAGSLQ